jgi:hypothetical protein
MLFMRVMQLQKMFVFGYTVYAMPFPHGSYILLKKVKCTYTIESLYQDEVVNVKNIVKKYQIKT